MTALHPPSQTSDDLDLVDWPERPAWHSQAACRGMNPNLWFPGRPENAQPAKDICNTCPVQTDCLEAGMSEKWGIWGGTSDKTRRQLRRQRRLLPTPTPEPGRPPAPIRHGTPSGYRAHYRQGSRPCPECAHAHRTYVAARQPSRKKQQTS